MLKPIAKAVAALSLLLCASFGVPAWAGDSTDERKCTAKHRHSKPAAAAKPAVAARPAKRGAGVAQIRREPDVQVFSYGP